MTRTFQTILFTAFSLLISTAAFAGLADPDGEFVLYKDAKFSLKGDYQAYSKHFRERDLNAYNGNNTATHPITEETYHTQTDEIEQYFEHELRLYPKVLFNDKLEFNMRLDVGGYIWMSDIANRVELGPDYNEEDITVAYEDYEKLKVMEANLQMITPIGLFLIGRFDTEKHGIVYAIQLPDVPHWTFAAAYLVKHEGKFDHEGLYVDYMQTKNDDYLDRDDQYESAIISIYEDVEDGEGLRSQQWVEFRGSDSKSLDAKNTAVFLPQWELNYDKGNLHFHSYMGMGFGTIAELSKMALADDIRDLTGLGDMLATMLQPGTLEAPNVTPKDIEAKSSFNFSVDLKYDMGKFTPQTRVFYIDGADAYNEVQGLVWDRFEPEGFRTPRDFKFLLLGEIEDKYFPLLATLGTYRAFDIDDIA